MTITRHDRAGIDDRWHKRIKNPDGTTQKVRSDLYGKVTRWRVRWVTDGHEYSKVFDRQTDAQTYLDGLKADVVRGEYVSPARSSQAFRTVAEEWLTTKANRRSKTVAGYRSLLDTLLLPRWGDTRLNEIRHGEVQKWITGLSVDGSTKTEGKGLSPSRVAQTHQCMSAIFKYAIRTDRLAKNPAEGVELPRSSENKRRYLTHKQLQSLASRTGRFETLTLLLGLCGLRWGEAVALRRKDIDTKKKGITVHASVTGVTGRGLVEDSTKTGRTRWVPIPGVVWDRLKGDLPKEPDGLVFPGKNGGYLTTGEYRWVFDKAAAESGVGGLIPHELRHTCASLAIAAGASVLVVQRLLGHATASMTLDRYGHLFNDDVTRVAEALDRAARSIVVFDDLDEDRTTKADETLDFGLEGSSYRVDLSHAHAEQLRSLLAPFIDAAARSTRVARGAV
jgi:integrase